MQRPNMHCLKNGTDKLQNVEHALQLKTTSKWMTRRQNQMGRFSKTITSATGEHFNFIYNLILKTFGTIILQSKRINFHVEVVNFLASVDRNCHMTN
jgi:hypothetical protein